MLPRSESLCSNISGHSWRVAVSRLGGHVYKNSTQWVHESNASWTVSAVEIC